MATDNHQPDIEIYVKNVDYQQIQEWLIKEFDSVDVPGLTHQAAAKGRPASGSLVLAGNTIPVMIMQSAAGNAFTSIWFKSNRTPWPDDEACARSFLDFFDTEVRYAASSWQEEEEEDEESENWWLLTRQEKRLIHWE